MNESGLLDATSQCAHTTRARTRLFHSGFKLFIAVSSCFKLFQAQCGPSPTHNFMSWRVKKNHSCDIHVIDLASFVCLFLLAFSRIFDIFDVFFLDHCRICCGFFFFLLIYCSVLCRLLFCLLELFLLLYIADWALIHDDCHPFHHPHSFVCIFLHLLYSMKITITLNKQDLAESIRIGSN